MRIIPILTFLADLTVNIWLLLIVWRREISKQLPWFSLYIAAEFAATCVGLTLWLVDRQLYVNVFWGMESVKIFLVVAAVRESFLRTFVGFSSMRWFPWAVRGVIASVILYSTWKAIYAPPVQNNRVVSLIIAGEFTFRWGVGGIGILSLVLVWLLELPRGTRETAALDGFTVASGGFLATVVSRSLFGTKYALIAQFFPDIGYLFAAFIWIKFMRRPETEFGFRELGMSPEMMALEMRRYREIGERLLGKNKSSNT